MKWKAMNFENDVTIPSGSLP